MGHLIWPSEPELKTTGIINKFTKKIEFNIIISIVITERICTKLHLIF